MTKIPSLLLEELRHTPRKSNFPQLPRPRTFSPGSIFSRSCWRRPGSRRCAYVLSNSCNLAQSRKGAFSAASTPYFASKYSLESSCRDLQDLHAFAPLRPQYFRKKSSNFFAFLAKFTHVRNNVIEFCSEFDDILPEFRKYLRKC